MTASHQTAKRILILGFTGAGKSTYARQLSHETGIPHVEVDRLYWMDRKGGAENPDFLKNARAVFAADTWIVEGLYKKIAEILPRPDVIYILDVPWTVLLLRLAWRDLIEFARGQRETSDFFWLLRNRKQLPSFREDELTKRWQTRVVRISGR